MVSKSWAGKTVVVIASGPSLTADDCALIEASGLVTVAVNSSWKMARFASVLYAGDSDWWSAYGDEVDIPAERWTCSRQAAAKHRINHHNVVGPYNSAARAAQFAVERGASRVILLGVDCSLKHGVHWHGAHTKTKNPDQQKIKRWHKQFGAVKRMARETEIINCSRHTELTCFPVESLESALERVNSDLAVGG